MIKPYTKVERNRAVPGDTLKCSRSEFKVTV